MATPPQPPNPYGPPAGGNPYQPNPAPSNPYAQPPGPGYGYPQQPPAPVPPQSPYGFPQQQQPPAAPPPPPGPGYGYPGTDPYAAGPGPAGQLTCRFCGGYPAADTTFRRHQGMIVIMRFIRVPGPFCRTCGTATFREMQAKTLIQGWWGYFSSVINWITIIRNVVALNRVNALPEPMPGPGQPMIPGPPVTRRPVMFIFAVPVLAFVLVLAALLTSGGSSNDTATYPLDSPTATATDGGTGSGDGSVPTDAPTDAGTGNPTTSPTDSSTDSSGSGDSSSSQYQVGDCLVEHGTGDSVTVTSASCTDSGAQKVLKVLPDTVDDTPCSSVTGYHDSLMDYDNNVVYCMGAKLQ